MMNFVDCSEQSIDLYRFRHRLPRPQDSAKVVSKAVTFARNKELERQANRQRAKPGKKSKRLRRKVVG